jgi:very-short-patch-repair endonuclease
LIKTRQLGLTNGGIAKRVANGTLHRKYQGVYAYGHPRLSQKGEWLAAVFAAGDGAALASLSAGVFWKVSRFRETTIHVVTPVQRRSQRRFKALTSTSLLPRDVLIRDGIPVTSVERTLIDMTDHLTAEQLANVIHEAAYLRLFNLRALRDTMARTRKRRMNVLERAIELHLSGSAGTRSHLEDRFLKLVRGAKVREPVVNAHYHDVEVDFRWGELCVEVDGGHHERERTKTEDRIKQAILEANGCTVVRFSQDDIDDHPAAVIAALKRAIRQNAYPMIHAKTRR